jgi:hypothetical protein
MRRIGTALVVMGLGMPSAMAPAADPTQVVAALSLPSVDEATADLEFLGRLIDSPHFVRGIGQALGRATGVAGLDGISTDRRWWAVVLTDGIGLTPIGLVPVTDGEAVLQLIGRQGGNVEPVEGNDWLWKFGHDDRTGYVREDGGWLYVAQSAEALARLPDPKCLDLAAGAPAPSPPTEDVGARGAVLDLHVQRLPEAYRTMAIDYLRGLGRPASEGDQPTAAFPAALVQAVVATALEQADRATLTWSLDHDARTAGLELSILPRTDPATGQPIDLAAALGANLEAHGAELATLVGPGLEPESAERLRRALAGEAAEFPMELTLRLADLVDRAIEDLPDEGVRGIASLAAGSLRAADDRIAVRVAVEEGGFSVRLDAREGTLRAAALGMSLAAIRALSAREP